MRVFVATPVCGRPYYFKQMLDSWQAARGVSSVEFVFSLEPVNGFSENLKHIQEFYLATQAKVHVILHNERQGPAKNHYVALQTAYDLGADHLILAEEDIIVSDDIIEYQEWGHRHIESVSANCALVCSYSTEDAGYGSEVRTVQGFPNCWLWGTSRNWWEFLGPKWDSSFSTGTGNEKGWDWNLARVIRQYDLDSLQPTVSRAQNIGEVGWSTGAGSLVEVATFEKHIPKTKYELV